jgi:hypothetical protein
MKATATKFLADSDISPRMLGLLVFYGNFVQTKQYLNYFEYKD